MVKKLPFGDDFPKKSDKGRKFEKQTLKELQLLFNYGIVLRIDPCCFTYKKYDDKIPDFIVELPFNKNKIKLIQTIQCKSYTYTSIWKHADEAFHDAIQDKLAIEFNKNFSKCIVAKPILYNKLPKFKWPKYFQNDSRVTITNNLAQTIEAVIRSYNQRPGDRNFPMDY
jgi:hypothetical protein